MLNLPYKIVTVSTLRDNPNIQIIGDSERGEMFLCPNCKAYYITKALEITDNIILCSNCIEYYRKKITS